MRRLRQGWRQHPRLPRRFDYRCLQPVHQHGSRTCQTASTNFRSGFSPLWRKSQKARRRHRRPLWSWRPCRQSLWHQHRHQRRRCHPLHLPMPKEPYSRASTPSANLISSGPSGRRRTSRSGAHGSASNWSATRTAFTAPLAIVCPHHPPRNLPLWQVAEQRKEALKARIEALVQQRREQAVQAARAKKKRGVIHRVSHVGRTTVSTLASKLASPIPSSMNELFDIVGFSEARPEATVQAPPPRPEASENVLEALRRLKAVAAAKQAADRAVEA